MKYKTLVMGKSNSVIDDFFIHMDDSFDVISCSTRYGDIIRHLKYFAPDVLVYCLYNESQESIRQMITIKPLMQKSRTPFIIIGSKEDCDDFERMAVNTADMTLTKPFTVNSIKEKIVKFLDERQPYVEAYREKNGISDINGSDNKEIEEVDISSLKNALSSLEAALNSTDGVPGQNTVQNSQVDSEHETKTEAETVSNERKHILVVDDDPIMLKTVKEQLHDEYDVGMAINGKIAMKFLERKRTDLVLLDYEMPGENGPAVLAKIRENDELKDIPVVFLTGVSDRDKIKEAIALRPQGYLLKPIDHNKLMETINNFVR
ncbi:MAG: response regulator [Lachnospiraceae bacterium]|nr:response regulator [Lachnospiraceae bacterium]